MFRSILTYKLNKTYTNSKRLQVFTHHCNKLYMVYWFVVFLLYHNFINDVCQCYNSWIAIKSWFLNSFLSLTGWGLEAIRLSTFDDFKKWGVVCRVGDKFSLTWLPRLPQGKNAAYPDFLDHYPRFYILTNLRLTTNCSLVFMIFILLKHFLSESYPPALPEI